MHTHTHKIYIHMHVIKVNNAKLAFLVCAMANFLPYNIELAHSCRNQVNQDCKLRLQA